MPLGAGEARREGEDGREPPADANCLWLGGDEANQGKTVPLNLPNLLN